MKKEIQKVILEQTDQVKARMACELNRWEWPKELEQFKEESWGRDYRPNSIQDTLGWKIISFIENIIGHKAFLKEWNKGNMSNKEFEEWYKDTDHLWL